MTFAPDSLRQLAAFWVAQGGVNSGIVGDTAHQARPSYHNGQDVIAAAGRTAATDYSIRLERDREPFLTNAAAAMDFGRLNGSLRQLQDFSRWFVAQARADTAGVYADLREWIYSPDGLVVRRWDHATKTLHVGGDGTGQGGNSHLWHSHAGFHRDSEGRDKRPMVAPYFTEANPMLVTKDPLGELRAAAIGWAPGAILYDLNGKAITPTSNTVAGRPSPYSILLGGVTYRLVLTGDDPANDPTLQRLVLVRTDDPKVTIGTLPDPTPFDQADLNDAKAAGFDAGTKAKDSAWEAWLAALPTSAHP